MSTLYLTASHSQATKQSAALQLVKSQSKAYFKSLKLRKTYAERRRGYKNSMSTCSQIWVRYQIFASRPGSLITELSTAPTMLPSCPSSIINLANPFPITAYCSQICTGSTEDRLNRWILLVKATFVGSPMFSKMQTKRWHKQQLRTHLILGKGWLCCLGFGPLQIVKTRQCRRLTLGFTRNQSHLPLLLTM